MHLAIKLRKQINNAGYKKFYLVYSRGCKSLIVDSPVFMISDSQVKSQQNKAKVHLILRNTEFDDKNIGCLNKYALQK